MGDGPYESQSDVDERGTFGLERRPSSRGESRLIYPEKQ